MPKMVSHMKKIKGISYLVKVFLVLFICTNLISSKSISLTMISPFFAEGKQITLTPQKIFSSTMLCKIYPKSHLIQS